MSNDSTIIELKKVLAQKKKDSVVFPFVPVTNCLLELHNVRYNLNTLNKESLIQFASIMRAYTNAAIELGFEGDLKFSGFLATEWITDILNRIIHIDSKEKKKEFDKLEAKLNSLLSEDKKTELALAEIKDLLS